MSSTANPGTEPGETTAASPPASHPASPPAPQPAPPAHAVPLARLPRGARGRVVGLSQERGERLARRLADLGFEPGREVEVGRRAPLGDPSVYRVADYSVSLRRRDAALVLVELPEARS